MESTSLLKATDTLVIDSAMMGISKIEIKNEQEFENDSMEMITPDRQKRTITDIFS